MIALFDTSALIYLLKPDAPAPKIKGTEERVSQCAERINYLLKELQRRKATIVIPTPVIAEIMVLAGTAGPEWLRILTSSKHFRPVAFDTIAAVGCAEMAKQRLGVRLSRAKTAKAKFDEQIVAIALVEGATTIYADDGDIRALAPDKIKVFGMEELPLPPIERQGTLEFEADDSPEEPPVEDDDGAGVDATRS